MSTWSARIAIGLAALTALTAASAARAEKRVALIIGNSAYQVSPLANPVNDAKAIAASFRRLGFDKVTLKTNLDSVAMKRALSDFGSEATGAEIAVVYFAGHGMENAGANYLIPVDARLARAADLDLEGIRLGSVLDQIDGASKLKLVILDACRNTAFPVAGSKRSTSRGLARVEPESNTLVAYAAKEGTVADDGSGTGNSPFTSALLRHLETPGLEVDYIFRTVRDEVTAATNKAQQPHLYGTLGRERIYFKVLEAPTAAAVAPPAPAVAAPVPPPAAAPVQSEAALAWAEVKTSTDASALEAFIKRYGDSFYGDLARGRLAELKRQQVAVVAPPPVSRVPPPVEPAVGVFGPEHKPGATFRDCPTCPEMVVVASGSFVMGSPESEERRNVDEYQQTVTIAKPFAVGKFEVTRDEFEAFVTATRHTTGRNCHTNEGDRYAERRWRTFRNPGYKQAGNHPVVCVSWEDAKAYVAWLSQKTGKPYRLLSEAEWEYAARAGTTTRYSFGDNANNGCSFANGADETARAGLNYYVEAFTTCTDGSVYTAVVGSFKPNAFGLYDMHGNVDEWVEDCWKDYTPAPADGSASTAGNCDRRHNRGGSFDSGPRTLRSASRPYHVINKWDNSVGIRVARTL